MIFPPQKVYKDIPYALSYNTRVSRYRSSSTVIKPSNSEIQEVMVHIFKSYRAQYQLDEFGGMKELSIRRCINDDANYMSTTNEPTPIPRRP